MRQGYYRLVLGVLVVLLVTMGRVSADGAQPLFVRVGVVEAKGATGPFDVTVRIVQIHQPPWDPNFAVTASNVPLGEMSKWMDLSPRLPAGPGQATATMEVSKRGQTLATRVGIRVRVELARSAIAASPLASKVIEDQGPAGEVAASRWCCRLGFTLPFRGVADAQLPQAMETPLEISQRHLEATAGFGLTRDEMPKKLVAQTGCHVSGVSEETVRNEVDTLLRLGLNTVYSLDYGLVKKFEFPYVALHAPAGLRLGDEAATTAFFGNVAQGISKTFGSVDRARTFWISDEPKWYLPTAIDDLVNRNPLALQGFRDYLREKGLQPWDFGQADWQGVRFGGPPGKGATASELRLWYHTVRFVDHEANRQWGVASRALRQAFGEPMLGFTNWNNPGIFYGRRKVGGTQVVQWAASNDWFDFARQGGGTCLWMGPGNAEGIGSFRSTFRAWSMMINLLRSAANEGHLPFGAFVHHNFIPDERGYEAELSIMALVGYGAKGYDAYLWGPAYAGTEFLWSERFGHYEAVADANRLIGRSEDLLLAGAPPKAEVALLWPVASQLFDPNEGYWGYNRDFLVEMENVWFALNHRNIPVEFLDEEMVRRGELDNYKVLYLTGANLEGKTAERIRDWVRSGGHLWTCGSAGLRDEGNEPLATLEEVLGVTGRQVQKMEGDYSPKVGLPGFRPLARVEMDPAAGLGVQPWNAYGSRADFQVTTGKVVGRFDDGKPAVIRNNYGQGASLHFATMPGLAYSREANEIPGVPTVGYRARIADLITKLPDELGVVRPVETSLRYVEAAMLRSDKGMAVTLLNWSGRPLEEVKVTIKDVPALRSVRSARLGDLKHEEVGDSISLTLPMPKVADVLLLEAENPQ